MPDTKLYIEWREKLDSYVVIYKKQVVKETDTQQKAKDWTEANYPDHAYEVERVQVRENSPKGAQIGEWHK